MAKAQPNRVKAETLSLRISPELKFGLELLSRIEERSLTTQVERALKDLFNSVPINSTYLGDYTFEYPVSDAVYFLDILDLIYSVDTPTRLIRTAIVIPATLSQKDLAILSLIQETAEFHGDDRDFFATSEEDAQLLEALTDSYFRNKKPLNMKVIRKNWLKINEAIDFAMEHGHYPVDLNWE